MIKTVKRLFTLVFLLAIVFGVGFVYFNFFDKGEPLSGPQEEIIASMGRPEQFILSYLPKGSDTGSEFVRHELWFYPSTKTKVTFLSGQVIATDDLELKEGANHSATSLQVEDFDVFTTVGDVQKLTGGDQLEPIDLPSFFGDGVETYASAQALFVFENDYLTYVETLD